MTLVQEIIDLAQRIATEFKNVFVGETYTGDLDSAPVGYTSFVAANVTNEPAGYSNGLLLVGKNEDDTGRVQIAYNTNGEYAIRWRLGGSWSSWQNFYPGYTDWANITNKPSTFAPSSHSHAQSDVTGLTTALAALAPLASPTFTGTLTAPTVKFTGGSPGLGKVLTSDADGDAVWTSPDDITLTECFQWWQTFTLHAVGVGQQDMGILVPFDCTITKIRYRCKTAGTGGSPLVEIRKNGTAGGNTVSGTSFAPATSPTWNTVSINLDADDLLYAYMTAINTTTVGSQIKVELLVVRR